MGRRDENPIGEWTIKVWDQGNSNTGKFLGWNMILWGECIDPTKTTAYEVNILDFLLPPPAELPAYIEPSGTTKQHAKPTEFLPGDHDVAEGENSNVAFTSSYMPEASGAIADSSSGPPGSTSVPTADEGWFKGMGRLSGNQKWFFVALAVVLVFSTGACLWLFRRRAAQRRQQYSSLPEEDVGMSSLRGSRAPEGRTTKELYDAFGEVSDDEADEETMLNPGAGTSNVGLGYHEEFLDDDEPSTAGGERYRDEPDDVKEARIKAARESSPSSGDGSWEHASST